MALFADKKEEKTAEVAETATQKAGVVKSNADVYRSVLISPRVTEKAAIAGEANVYVFNVYTHATKNEIKKAIEKMYKVVPEKVNIVQIPARKTFIRGRRGSTARGKKAYVYLKKGDKISVI